jgi:staphylococcal nuclease domain-containing protein 1
VTLQILLFSRLSEAAKAEPRKAGSSFRPLYDIPFMFEAREFLRKKLIGQNVHVIVDYIQPSNNDFPEKTCGTVTIGGVNVAEAIVSKGLANVVRYSADNDQRSGHYDDLLSAEDKAKKSSKGMHSSKNTDGKDGGGPTCRIADLSGDVNKSKQFLPFLQRAGRMQAVVEFVASGSRCRLYIPRETCVITFLLSGISCPRAGRTMPGGVVMESEPFGDEALAFVKDMVLQREVEIEVEAIDKGGNFIGWCFVDNTNISVALVEEGYAAAHGPGDKSNYGRLIAVAEENAKGRMDKRWANYVEKVYVEEHDDKKDEGERNIKYETVVVTEVTPEARIYAQNVDEGPKLENLMKQLREEFTRNPPLAGSYTAKRGKQNKQSFYVVYF